MTFGSVCSGIEAASVAWEPLGFTPAWFAEIEPFPSAVLKHHWPHVHNHGDFTKIGADAGPIDVLVGGTPCQTFSVAGKRAGLDDPRGHLTLEFLALAKRLRPRWVCWENVPGVLSDDGGRTLGTFLGLLGQLGYGWAYRVLDAQYAGVPQRRRRVFVVGHLGDWQRAAAVLFERHSLSGDTPPSRKAGQGLTGGVAPCLNASGRGVARPGESRGQDPLVIVPEVAMCLNAHGSGRIDVESETFIAQIAPTLRAGGNRTGGDRPPGTDVDTVESLVVTHALRGEGFDASEDGTGRGTPLVPLAFHARQDPDSGPVTHPLDTDGHSIGVAVAFSLGSHSGAADADVANKNHANGGPTGLGISEELSHSIRAGRTNSIALTGPVMAVRRLTPLECERLQGFPQATKRIQLTICGEQLKNDVLAEILSRKSPAPVGTAESAPSLEYAPCAHSSSHSSDQNINRRAAINVRIDLERSVVELHRAERSNSDVTSAASESWFLPPTQAGSFAHLVALTTSIQDLIIGSGKVASPQSTTYFTHLGNGSGVVLLSGQEIEEFAKDADAFIKRANDCLKFTISEVGATFQNLERTLATLSCCVYRAISSYIPEPIRNAPLFDINLTTTSGHTLVPYRGKLAADGPRYKAIGNSMCIPVMAWIGRRILEVAAK